MNIAKILRTRFYRTPLVAAIYCESYFYLSIFIGNVCITYRFIYT